MSRISVDVSSARIPVLQVGYQGENEVTDVLFDISSWITEFGEGVAQLRVKRPGNSEEESYVLSLTITDGIAVWTVSETDTFNKGNGKVQLSYLVGNIVKKAVIYPYKVGKSIVGADNPVDPFDSWIERSKAWAIGETLDGNAVPETDETYQNNAKYYAEQADILGSAQVVLATEQVTLATEKATLATEKADAAAASETNAAASEAAVNGVSTQLTTRMTAIETEQSVQSARMDTFTSLPEGSTSGNAELADIRVGANGTTYDTAGNAVRGQISELKSDLDFNTSLLECAKYDSDGYLGLNGKNEINTDYHHTDFIEYNVGNNIYIIDCFAGGSSLAIAFYDDDKIFISGINNVKGNLTVLSSSVPNRTAYFRCCSAKKYGEDTFNSKVYSPKLQDVSSIAQNAFSVAQSAFERTHNIQPNQTTFFDNVNWFDVSTSRYYNDRYCDTNGKVTKSSSVSSLVFDVEPNTTYTIYIPNHNRDNIVENNGDFILNETYPIVSLASVGVYNGEFIFKFTTGDNTTKVMYYFLNSSTYDYDTLKSNIILRKGSWNADNARIKSEYLPENINSVLDDTQILIFGDSITDCCTFTINSDKKTTAYNFRNPSNSYVNESGETIQYSMWAKILKETQNCKEIRNYAMSGASYKTLTREAGNERQNLHYQIDVALNDVDNPNGVFEVNSFNPDIVIFALGTNDGTPNDSYTSAMDKTVLKDDNISIDIDSTLSALDETKFCESARKAFMRIKQSFPMAQIYCVLPIQRADYDNTGTLHSELKQMAERYGCIIIDGTFDFGITRDFNNWNAIGTYLKDGLHPNEKGQNLMARGIISSIESHFRPFKNGYNLIN